MKKRNFLLGKGERLTEQVKITSGGGPKMAPYTFAQAKERLAPMLTNALSKLDSLPQDACPNNEAIATLTLNPEYIAKSYFPGELLRAVGLEAVGSRSKKIKPEKRSRGREPEASVTTELFIKGPRSSFKRWASEFSKWNERNDGASQLVGIETISVPDSADKIKQEAPTEDENGLYEIVLHCNEGNSEEVYLAQFKKYLKNHFDIDPKFEKRFYAGGLCFLELETNSKNLTEIAKFSLVRVIRSMPSLRMLRPAIRATTIGTPFVTIPDKSAIDPSIRVAIFDGGIPIDHPVAKWATQYEIPGVGAPEDELMDHGVAVTSAFLFGHIDQSKPLETPYSKVDHYRVLDSSPGQNPYELYEVLDRIVNVLQTENYDFINLSLGPRLPITDDDVHAWTAVLDEHFAKGNTLATIAVGNDGEGDATISANRIQVPADCVNALSIGACDTPDEHWKRAPYSSVGPGRSPGLIKPDLVDFGGSMARPFLVLDPVNIGQIKATGGTSFSAPNTLRIGTGIRAHFGNSLNALAIKALLIHSSEASELPKHEVGWGRVARSLDEIVLCEDHVVRVVFQGTMTASKYTRTPIPIPAGALDGMVNIKATLCYATSVDPHHPGNYTRSGLEIAFRPHKDKRIDDAIHAKTTGFFGKSTSGQTEEELRRDANKWENCLHAEKRMRGSSLKDPAFDIHYNARIEGRNDSKTQEIHYALIITVSAPTVADLYDQVVRRYATQLEALQPTIDIPVRV